MSDKKIVAYAVQTEDGRVTVPYPAGAKTGSREVAYQYVRLNGGKVIPLIAIPEGRAVNTWNAKVGDRFKRSVVPHIIEYVEVTEVAEDGAMFRVLRVDLTGDRVYFLGDAYIASLIPADPTSE